MRKYNRGRSVACCCPVDVQQLESRQLLTGTVKVSVSKSGDISITGERQDNDISIQVNDDDITITGNDTSLKFGKSVIAPGEDLVLDRPSSIRDIDVKLDGGNDYVTISLNSETQIKRNVKISTGTGNDYVSVFAASDVQINGDVKISTGSGDDDVYVSSNGGLMDIRGSLSVDTGNGDDSVTIADEEKFDLEALAESSAEDWADFADDTEEAGVQMIRVGKDIDISTGTGNDDVVLLGVEAGRDVEVDSGLGHGDVLAVSNVRAGRDMELRWGDLNAINNVTVVRELEVDSGTGHDRFTIDNLYASRVDVNTGAGDDTVAIGGNVVVTKSAKLRGGAGNDNIDSLSDLSGASVKSFEGDVADGIAILDEVLSALFS